jgi:hypothetical protein
MDDYASIDDAARHRDWNSCDRIMFRQLFLCSTKEQKIIAAQALLLYRNIWNEKHPKVAFPWRSLEADAQPNALPQLREPLDPADAEFENAAVEYIAGTSGNEDHSKRTAHFASAIRSSVLAIQINRWVRDFPQQYQRWRSGRSFEGPTFLDDEQAATDAENAWKRVEALFPLKRAVRESSAARNITSTLRSAETAYDDWERTLF